MQLWERSQLVVGLDIGQNTVKAVALVCRAGQPPVVAGMRALDCRAEGILDPEELLQHLPKWLAEAGWGGAWLMTGLPAHVATTRVVDFPPAETSALASMVEYETQQLAGLSDERFVHDFVRLPPRTGHPNPVLLASCRQGEIETRGNDLTAAGLNLAGFGVASLSMANGFLALNPGSAETGGTLLLLDLGAGGSSTVILNRGQIVHAGVLAMGTARIAQLVAKQLQVSEEDADRLLLQGGTEAKGSAALLQAFRALEAELRGELDTWRLQERPLAGDSSLAGIRLCGGGAQIPGLAAFLATAFDCKAEETGVPVPTAAGTPPPAPETAAADPRFLTAYGLALLGTETAAFPIKLATRQQEFQARRRKNFKYAAAATAMLVLSLGFAFLWMFNLTRVEKQALDTRLRQLIECDQKIPQLKQTTAQLDERERMLLPIVAKANRAWRFQEGIAALTAAKGADDWVVYLADADSYRDNAPNAEGRADGAVKPEKTPAAATGLFGIPLLPVPTVPAASGADIGLAVSPEFPTRILSTNVKPLRALVVAGYTPLQTAAQPYKPVRDIIDKLNHGDLFAKVDLIPMDRNDFFQPWYELFKDRPDMRCKAFTLRLPYATQDLTGAAAEGKTERAAK